jgi:hypothetical protein
VVARLDDQPVALIGGADGFVAAVDLATGKIIRRRHLGAPVIGIATADHGSLVIATHRGLTALDADWQPQATLARNLNRALPLAGHRLLVSHTDHTLELLNLR